MYVVDYSTLFVYASELFHYEQGWICLPFASKKEGLNRKKTGMCVFCGNCLFVLLACFSFALSYKSLFYYSWQVGDIRIHFRKKQRTLALYSHHILFA